MTRKHSNNDFFLTSSPTTEAKGSSVLTEQQKIPNLSPPGTGAKNSSVYSCCWDLMPGLHSSPYCWMLHCDHLQPQHVQTFWRTMRTKDPVFMKTNLHFSMETLGFMSLIFSMNIINVLSSVFNLIKINRWMPWQHGNGGSDYLGSLDPGVLSCRVTPSSWIFQEGVAQCSLLILITNTANASRCIHGILKRWLGNSKRRCSTKGIARPIFMITLQQSKLKCIYLSTATWKCGALESVSWATYSIPSFPVSWCFYFI